MPTNPCDEAERLKSLRTLIITGAQPSAVRFGEEEVRYHRADLGRLDLLIDEADRECAVSLGAPPKRMRFARRVRFI